MTEISNKERVDKFMKEIFKAINSYNNDEVANKIFECIISEHRTLQQNFWRMMFDVIKQYGSDKTLYDGRNADSKRVCQLLSQVIDKENLPYI